MVSTHLNNISQTGSSLQVRVKINNIWNHQLEEVDPWNSMLPILAVPSGANILEKKNGSISRKFPTVMHVRPSSYQRFDTQMHRNIPSSTWATHNPTKYQPVIHAWRKPLSIYVCFTRWCIPKKVIACTNLSPKTTKTYQPGNVFLQLLSTQRFIDTPQAGATKTFRSTLAIDSFKPSQQ